MIDKMTKYSFILLSGQTDDFLERIREMGVMDITRSSSPVDSHSAALLERARECRNTVSRLERTDYSGEPDYEKILKARKDQPEFYDDPVEAAAACTEEIGLLQDRISASRKSAAELKVWGEFDKDMLDRLEESGYTMHFYSISRTSFKEEWKETYPLEVILDNGLNIWFVTIVKTDEEYSLPVSEMKKPEASYKEAEAETVRLQKELIKKKGEMLRLKDSIGELQAEYEAKLSELDLYLAGISSERVAEDTVTVMQGFAPVENDTEICSRLDAMDVFYLKEAATEEDNPPIKFRNNRFTRMFEVLTDLYGRPVYGEFDPTPILAPFFLLFFAMCMGDAGYGLVLILFGIGVHKDWIKIGMFKNLGPIISTLGVGTLLVGTVLGTAFGMDLYAAGWVPDALKKIMIPGSKMIFGFSAQMVLALGIGVFHICLAMTVKAIGYTKRFGFRNTVSIWGWLLLILGGIAIAGLAFLDILDSEVVKWAVIILGIVSGLGIYIFNTPGRNPLVNIGSGLWDTYNMVTGLLGDVLSYVRLYALGLAGGMLGSVFNDLGTMILGQPSAATWQWLPFIVILLAGHLLNLAMSCLGAFVHPLRLTFVEYFKNSGYEGKGKAYNPLTIKDKE